MSGDTASQGEANAAEGTATITDDGSTPTPEGDPGDDDRLSVLSISSLNVSEGSPAQFDITLTNESNTATDVVMTLSDGSANAGADYDATSVVVTYADSRTETIAVNGDGTFTVSVPANDTTFSITVQTEQDPTFEGDETFTLSGYTASQGEANAAEGTATITDDGSTPTPEGDPGDDDRLSVLSISSLNVSEGSPAQFDITLTNESNTATDVVMTLSDGSANAGADYDATSVVVTYADSRTETIAVNGDGTFTVSVPANDTTFSITVQTEQDPTFEGDETFTLSGYTASQGEANAAEGTATITDDGSTPTPEGDPGDDDRLSVLSISSLNVSEGSPAQFDITLTNESNTATDVVMTLSDGSANAGADYDATSVVVTYADSRTETIAVNGDGTFTVSVPANDTTFSITVQTEQDPTFEGDETFTLSGYTASQGEANAAEGTATITDDDPLALVLKDPIAYVSEEGLSEANQDDEGQPDTTNLTTFTGQFTYPEAIDFNNIVLESPKSNDSNWSKDGDSIVYSVDGVTVIRVDIAEIDSTTGSYTVTLFEPLDHPDTESEDALTVAFDISISDGVTSSSSEVSIVIEDDSPEGVDVEDSVVLISSSTAATIYSVVSLEGGFTDINFESTQYSSKDMSVALETDSDSLKDLLSWDDSDSDATQLSLVDSSSSTSQNVGDYLTLGQFTHKNSEIDARYVSLENSEVSYNAVLNIDGVDVTVTLTADLSIEQPLNSSSDPADVVTLTNLSSQEVTVNGNTYNISLEGFLVNGQLSSTLKTDENDSQTVPLVAKVEVVSEATEYSEISGNITLSGDFGADGGVLAAQTITDPEYGTITIAVDGSYVYQPSESFANSIAAGTTSNATFVYTTVDNDGDYIENTLVIAVANDAAATVSDTAFVVEGSVISASDSTSVLANDANSNSLTVVGIASNENGDNADTSSTGVFVLTTSLGGKVTMYSDGTYEYEAPVLDHTNEEIIEDSFTYQVSDGSSVSDWTTVTINVQDTNIDTLDDVATLSVDETATGNVFDNDTGADTPFTLTSVEYKGTVYEFQNGSSSMTIDADSGTLTISTDGQYTFVADENLATTVDVNLSSSSNVSLYGILSGSYTNADGTLISLTEDLTDNVSKTGAGIGVGEGDKSPIDADSSSTETLVVGFDSSVSSINMDIKNSTDNDKIDIQAFDAQGNPLSTDVTFGATSGNNLTNVIVSTSAGEIAYIAFSLTDDATDNDNYRVIENIVVTYSNDTDSYSDQEVFTYTAYDQDGDTDSAVLTIGVADGGTTVVADVNQINEDESLNVNTSEGVLANDSNFGAVSVATFTIAGVANSYAAGSTVTIENVGEFTLESDGSYTFDPVEHWAGEVPVVTYTTTEGESTTLSIDVVAVADTPIFTGSGEEGLILTTWDSVKPAVDHGGKGLNPAELSYLVDSYDVSQAESSAIVQSVPKVSGVPVDTLTTITGYIYLEAGSTYSFSGDVDDGFYVKISDELVADGQWNGSEANNFVEGSFTAEESGYYAIEIAHHNEDGPGYYDVYMSVDGGDALQINSTNFDVYPSAEAVLTADFDASFPDGVSTNAPLNAGDEGTDISIQSFNVTFFDTEDGSETHTVSVSGGPVGATLSDGVNEITFTSSTELVDVTGWDFENLTINVPSVEADETFTLNFFATAIESSNGDLASASKSIDVTVYNVPETTPITINVTSADTVVSEEALSGGIEDNDGSPSDSSNSAVDTGNFIVSGASSTAVVSLAFIDDQEPSLTSNGFAITWTVSPNSLVGMAGTTEVISISLNSEGNGEYSYDVELSAPIVHAVKGAEDIESLGINIVVTDGDEVVKESVSVSIEDDSPSLVDVNAVVTSANTSSTYTGMVDFTGSAGDQSSMSFNDGVVTVTAKGFADSSSDQLTDANVYQYGSGVGVNSSGDRLETEIDYRVTNSSEQSEQLIVSLDDGKVAYGAEINFTWFFGGTGSELEVAVLHFYRDGELVATKEIQSDQTSGVVDSSITITEGGFDTIVFESASNGNGAYSDNSDYSISSITFTGASSDTVIAEASGTVGNIGADGFGSVTFAADVAATIENLFAQASVSVDAVVLNSGNRLLVEDENGDAIFEIQLTPATGQWEFFQYQELSGVDSALAVGLIVEDADGDSSLINLNIDAEVATGSNDTSGDSNTDNTSSSGVTGDDELWKPNNIVGDDQDNEIYAGADDDTVKGGLGDDTLYGESGDDQLFGEEGNDILDGGSQNDTLYGGDGEDSLLGKSGDDELHGGLGDDLLDGGSNLDSLYGEEGNDTLKGGSDDDSLHGGADDDSLYGEGNNDLLDGGEGNDYLDGGAGADNLLGGAGDDVLFGGVDYGSDTMTGGSGEDIFILQNDNANDVITDFNAKEDALDVTDLFDFSDDDDIQALLQENLSVSESGVVAKQGDSTTTIATFGDGANLDSDVSGAVDSGDSLKVFFNNTEYNINIDG